MQNKQSESASMSSEWLKTESKIAYSDLKSVISRQSFYLYLKKKVCHLRKLHTLLEEEVRERENDSVAAVQEVATQQMRSGD